MSFPPRQWTSKLQAFPGIGLGGPVERPPPSMPYPGPLLSRFRYTPSALVLASGFPMTAYVPEVLPVGAAVTKFTMTPDPPAGLTFSQKTGILTGTPTTPQPATPYVMRAFAGTSLTWEITVEIT